jgi:hypothetical protein
LVAQLGHDPSYAEALEWSNTVEGKAKVEQIRELLRDLPSRVRKQIIDNQILRNVQAAWAPNEKDKLIRALDWASLIPRGITAVRALLPSLGRLFSGASNLVGRGVGLIRPLVRSLPRSKLGNLALGVGGGYLGEKVAQRLQTTGDSDEDDDSEQIYNPSATNAYEGRQYSTMIKRQLGHDHNGENSSYSINSVNAGYACCSILAPKYSELRPGEYGVPFSLSKIVNTYSFPTSPTGGTWPGSLQTIIFPLNVFNPGSGQNNAYITYSNDITYNPATGLQTPAKGLVAGPMYSLVSNVTKFSVIACNVKIFFTASELNNSGTVQVSYWTGQPNNTFYSTSVVIAVTQSEQTNWPYYMETNLTGKSIDVGDLPELDLPSNYYYANQSDPVGDSNFDFTDFGYVITITGAQAATQVMRFDITTIMAIVPSSATLPLCPTRMAPPGQATVSFLLSLYKICPSLLMAETEKKAALCNFIQNSGITDHDTLLNAILEAGILPAC